MKSILTTLILILGFTVAVNAQISNAAIETQSGRYLKHEAGQIPPSNEVTAAQLATATAVTILHDKKVAPAEGVTVQSYKMTIIRKQGNIELTANNGNITPQMKEELEKLQPGNKVYFENIKALLPDGSIMEMTALDFIIKG